MSGFAVAVVGFPRSGSSMMMRMLDAGGIPPVAGSAPVSYELSNLLSVPRMRPSDLAGRAIKLLDFAQYPQHYGGSLPPGDWRFVWLDRDREQQAKSTVKFMRGIGNVDVPQSAWKKLADSFRHDRDALVSRYAAYGPVHVESYEAILADPTAAAVRLGAFLPGLSAERASHIPSNRSSLCAPDLSFELGCATAKRSA